MNKSFSISYTDYDSAPVTATYDAVSLYPKPIFSDRSEPNTLLRKGFQVSARRATSNERQKVLVRSNDPVIRSVDGVNTSSDEILVITTISAPLDSTPAERANALARHWELQKNADVVAAINENTELF